MNLPRTWPRRRLAEALATVAWHGRLLAQQAEPLPETPASFDDAGAVPRWLDQVCEWLDLEVDPIGLPYGSIAATIENAAPALVALGDDDYVAVVRRDRRGTVLLAGPDGAVEPIATQTLAQAIEHHALVSSRAPLKPLRALLRTTASGEAERQNMERALVNELLTRLPPEERCWSLRPRVGASALSRIARLGGLRYALLTLGAHVLGYALMLVAWVIVGQGILSGRDDPGWQWAWALMLLSTIPLTGILAWAQGRLTIGLGVLVRERLLEGSLRFDRRLIQKEGVGVQLGRVLEAENLDGAALGGGLTTALALSEFVVVVWMLTHGCTGSAHALLAIGWLIALFVLVARLYQAQRDWVRERLARTAQLFERMVGHRTRLAQQHPARLHTGEDQALTTYLDAKHRVDRRSVILDGAIGRAWVLASVALLLAHYVDPHASFSGLGITLGATLLGAHALDRVSRGVSQLVGATVAWSDARPFFDAAATSRARGIPALAASVQDETEVEAGTAVLEAHDVDFRYTDRGALVLDKCTTTIACGDRVLLEGPSGSGKSTLVSLLAGLQEPQAGSVLLRGLDRHTIGASTWRRRVVVIPQFHENYLVSNTLAFNLLMGRRWPPTAADLRDAHAICEGLGLGTLLERMPAGMQQVVGETGWQLSHGERSRVFIARALLQQPDCVIFDESFGALDPENLTATMTYALERTKTAIVIAHP